LNLREPAAFAIAADVKTLPGKPAALSPKEAFMTFRFAAVIVAAALSVPAFAEDKAPPKASASEVRKLVERVKGDKDKFSLYCELVKVQEGYQEFAERQNDPRLEELDKKMAELTKKLGPEFARVAGADLDEEGEALFNGLASSCPSSI
jgi:hypothetical protein